MFKSSILFSITEVNILNREYNNYIPEIHEFNNITEEIEFIAYKICDLINNKIDILNNLSGNLNTNLNNNNFFNSNVSNRNNPVTIRKNSAFSAIK